MEDIYDDTSTSDYIDGVVGGVILSEFLTENSDSAYQPGVDAQGNRIGYTNSWKKLFSPPTDGCLGVISGLVRVATAVWIALMIAALVYCAVTGA